MSEDHGDVLRSLEVTPEDSLDETTRRALLQKLARAGATAIPVSVVLLNTPAAQAQSCDPDCGKPVIVWGS